MQLPKRRGLALTIIGAVLMLLLAPAAAGVGVWQGVTRGMSAVNGQPWIAPGATVRILDHDSQTILVEGSYPTGTSLPGCRVTGPGGARVPVDQGTTRLSMDWSSTALTRAGTFTAPSAGTYTVDCSGLRAKVLDSGVADDIARRVLIPAGIGVGLGALAFVVGVILLIIGIVKLVNSGRERSRARDGWPGDQGPYGGPAGYQPPGGYGGQPPYGSEPPEDPYRR